MTEEATIPARRRGKRLALALVVLAPLGGAGWYELQQRLAFTSRPSVLLVTIDTLRADRVGAYGHTANKTPAIDRIAREGALFETAYCDIPWTTGSMSSVMTGQYSSSHGVDLPSYKLKDDAVTMAEILRDNGYRTGAIIGSFPLDSVFGLDQGFQTYDDTFTMPMLEMEGEVIEHVASIDPEDQSPEFGVKKFENDSYRPDEQVTDAAVRWLDDFRKDTPQNPWLRWVHDRIVGERYFLWVHYFGPHEKLKGGRGFVDQEPDIVAAYDGDVEKADTAVGRLFDRMRELGILDDTLVVIHADHGQNLGEFGVVGHGQRIDEATVRIPMILRYPTAFPSQTRRVDVARNVDILPTVMQLTNSTASGLVGRSLLAPPGDPRGERVPAGTQVAYFETRQPTLFYQPILVPVYWTVLGPMVRSGIRTMDWRYQEDQIVGACVYGGQPSKDGRTGTPKRDGFGTWYLPGPKLLEESKCRDIRAKYLYPVSEDGDGAPNVANSNREVLATLGTRLEEHAAQRAPLSSKFKLNVQQEEKLRSLGYLK